MEKLNPELSNFYEQLIVRGSAALILGMVGILCKLDYSESQDGFRAYHVIVWTENIKRPGKKMNLVHTVEPTRARAAETGMRMATELYFMAEPVYHLTTEPSSVSRSDVEDLSEIDTID